MDYIALVGTNCLLRRAKTNRRLFFTAFLSAMGNLACTIGISNPYVKMLLVHFVLNTILILFCFKGSTKKEFMENWAVTYGMTVFLGGMMSFFTKGYWKEQNFAIGAVISALALSVTNYYLRRRKQFANQIFPVVLKHRGQSISLKAYWDSGNQLKDPYNGKPVCIISNRVAEKIMHPGKDFVRFVPYISLGQKDGLLPVIQIECMKIYEGKKKIEIKPAEVGIANEGLLEQKEYDLILHASFLESQERGKWNGSEIRNTQI